MLDEAESYFSRAHIDYLDWCTSANVHAAARIVAVSETTARDVIRTYGVPAGIVRVLLNSHDDAVFNANIDEDNVAATLAELDIRGPFFLHVGTIQPRKNLPTVIRAFEAFAAGGGDHQLLLVGAQGWRAENAADTGLPDLDSFKGVRLLGSLATEQIAHIMTAADALVMAGFYEGFGLPALEAMACGTPVLAANAGALPEVVGDAGLLFDPNDPDELTALMARIASDPDRRSQLGRRALARAAEFSRDSQARGLIELAEEIA
jgi:glycosyltransferase involved in cell wall biosynthesis